MQAYFSFNLLRWRQPLPVTRLPVLNSVTDSSRHRLLLPALHSQWSRQVYIIHRSIIGFLVVQSPYVRMHMSIGYLEPLVQRRIHKEKQLFFYVSSGNRTRELCICSPIPYPLDYGDTPPPSIAKINI